MKYPYSQNVSERVATHYVEYLESKWNDVLHAIFSIDSQLHSVSFTEVRETKESLTEQGRIALDDTIAIYKSMLDDFRSAV